MIRFAYRAMYVFAFMITILWIVGIVCSDRWFWSQWLAWIPTIALLAVLFLVATVSFIAKNKCMTMLFIVVIVVVFIRFVFVENALLRRSNSAQGLSLVGWTMSHPNKKGTALESAKEIIKLNGDITLLTHGWFVRGEPSLKDWLEPNGRRVINGPFTLLTKLPVIEVRTLVASDGIFISLFSLDASEYISKPLVLWAIDLPSGAFIPRIETAKRVNRLLSRLDTTEPDIVIDDFNMGRNSFSIQSMFPALTDASETAGEGLLATFPLELPLYHIDHMLVNNKLMCNKYTIINPHIGKHRIQKCLLIPNYK